MKTVAGVCAMDEELLLPTSYRIIDVADEAIVGMGCLWWENLTAGGGEGMVVKPLNFIAKGKRGLVQSALKCRGREYLRIIYNHNKAARLKFGLKR